MPLEPALAARVHEIPSRLVELCPFAEDYVDLFTLPSTPLAVASPEEWARAAMEGAPAAGTFLAWRVLCNLKLEGGGSAQHIAGWRIVDQQDDWIRVEARSWFMTANAIFKVEADETMFATFIRYDRAVARLIWGPVSAFHRAAAPAFLAAARNRIARSQGAAALGRARTS